MSSVRVASIICPCCDEHVLVKVFEYPAGHPELHIDVVRQLRGTNSESVLPHIDGGYRGLVYCVTPQVQTEMRAEARGVARRAEARGATRQREVGDDPRNVRARVEGRDDGPEVHDDGANRS